MAQNGAVNTEPASASIRRPPDDGVLRQVQAHLRDQGRLDQAQPIKSRVVSCDQLAFQIRKGAGRLITGSIMTDPRTDRYGNPTHRVSTTAAHASAGQTSVSWRPINAVHTTKE